MPTFDDDCAWYGPQMAARDDWIETLSAGDVAEIDAAVARATARGAAS